MEVEGTALIFFQRGIIFNRYRGKIIFMGVEILEINGYIRVSKSEKPVIVARSIFPLVPLF
jgi:hypothetical protein